MELKPNALLMFSKLYIYMEPFHISTVWKSMYLWNSFTRYSESCDIDFLFWEIPQKSRSFGKRLWCLLSFSLCGEASNNNKLIIQYLLHNTSISIIIIVSYNLVMCLCMFSTDIVCIYIKCVHWCVCNFKHIKSVLYNINKYFLFCLQTKFHMHQWLISYHNKTERKI